jgi:hypothetical protein
MTDPLTCRGAWDPRRGVLTRTSWVGGDDIQDVECTVVPGSGRLIITGLGDSDLWLEPGVEASDTAVGNGATRDALTNAITWLSLQQDREWFQSLPVGAQRMDIIRRVLIYGGKKRNRDGRAKRGGPKEEPADIHIHFPTSTGSFLPGLAICVVLAEAMRGCRTKLRALYLGGVQVCGSLIPIHAQEETITRTDFDVLITTEQPGQQRLGFPRSVPQGVSVVGFAHAKEVLEYVLREENLMTAPAAK